VEHQAAACDRICKGCRVAQIALDPLGIELTELTRGAAKCAHFKPAFNQCPSDMPPDKPEAPVTKAVAT
jgi:hypothetical protein